MIGFRGELVTIASAFSVGSLREPYLAIGSGRHNAYALHALADSRFTGEERVRRALEAAVNFTSNVRPPFVVLSTGIYSDDDELGSHFMIGYAATLLYRCRLQRGREG